MSSIKYKLLFGGFLLSLAIIAGCTLDTTSAGEGTLTEEDLQATGEVLGEALSSDNSGVLLSLNDALTSISSQDFIPATHSSTLQNLRSGRGDERNYQYRYDQNSGIHNISFDRVVNQPLFSKTVTDTLNYIFKDAGGNVIELPREESNHIESITYNGRREGEIITSEKNSYFVRRDTFLVDGVSDASAVLSIDGVHNSEGVIDIDTPTDNFRRNYELEINFLNIEIRKSATGNINFRRGVTGTQSWEMTVSRIGNGRTGSQTLRGTIELSGDGTALLRFQNAFQRYQINLNDGDVKNQDEEFEGQVQSVNLSQQNFTLLNGRTIYLNENTEIDDDDYPSLEAVQQAINNEFFVWAEGEGELQDGQFVAEEVEFENEDNDDEEGSIEFEERVTSVNLTASTFTLAGSAIVKVTEETIFDDDGDYQTLQAVSEALNNGLEIEAEGNAYEAIDDPSVDLIATEVEFEQNEDDED